MNYLFKEAVDILKTPANFKKLPNIFLAVLSYFICKITKKNFVLGYPFMLMLEPTNICNLRCPLCITGSKQMTRENGVMEIENFRKLMDELGKYLVHLTLWSQGEPFVNRHFTDMVRIAKNKGIKTMTSTNGHFLIENAETIVKSGLDVLIVAMDGASQKTYEKYRVNGNFKKVYDGMKAVTEAKKKLQSKTPEIELQFIVMKHNEHETNEIRSLAYECGAQIISFKTAQVYTPEQAKEFLPTKEKYRRYELDVKGQIKTKNKEINFCRWVLLCPVINWDGTVSPCCFDKNAENGLGNVFTDGGLKRIWKNKEYARFRQQIFHKRKEIPICSNCSEGLEVDIFEKEKVRSEFYQSKRVDILHEQHSIEAVHI